MRKYQRNKEKELVEVDFEGEGLAPVSVEAIKAGSIVIVISTQSEERRDEDSHR